MKHMIFAPALVMAAYSLGSTPLLAAAKGSDEAQIKALEQRIADGANAGDVDAIVKNYAPDETLLVFDIVPPREYKGADAFRKDWQGFFDRVGPVRIENSDMNVTSDGKMAFATYIAHLTGKGRDDNPMDVTMLITDVLRKSSGKWLIVHEHVSVPVDLASGKAEVRGVGRRSRGNDCRREGRQLAGQCDAIFRSVCLAYARNARKRLPDR